MTETLQSPAPPENLEAEEAVLGACLLSPTAIEAAREHLAPEDFYRPSHGRIFGACTTLLDQGDPVDPVTVAAHLRTQGSLEEIGGNSRIAELAALVSAVSNAGHYARIVRDTSKARYALAVSHRLGQAARNGGLTSHPEILRELEDLLDTPGGTRTLRPLWWHDAMNEPVPETSEYVQDVLQAGVLADIVGLPYLHKTAIALELSVKVARGTGYFLGRHPVKQQAPVAYFWADDSRAKELERIQAYGRAHELDRLPLALYLNPGLVIPDDLPAVRAQIREHGYRLVVFDSLYNFCPGIDFTKDHAKVTTIYAALKRMCDGIEGLTVILVDHSAKPSDSNRGRDAAHSSFGSIFKAASVRCTIAVQKENDKLYLSATGNNIRGFPKTPAFFAEEQLEIRLVERAQERQDIDEAVEQMLRKEVIDWLEKHPDENSSNKIRQGVRRGRNVVFGVLDRMAAEGLLEDVNALQTTLDIDPETSPDGAQDRSGLVQNRQHADQSRAESGTGQARSWRISRNPSVQAEKPVPSESQDWSGSVVPGTGSESASQTGPETSPPIGGDSGPPAERVEPDNPDDDIDFGHTPDDVDFPA